MIKGHLIRRGVGEKGGEVNIIALEIPLHYHLAAAAAAAAEGSGNECKVPREKGLAISRKRAQSTLGLIDAGRLKFIMIVYYPLIIYVSAASTSASQLGALLVL